MDLRLWLFNHRSYTPLPLLVAALVLAEPTWLSFALGFLLACLGEAIRIWGVAHAGAITRTTDGTKADELVMTGPYAHVRNPLYWGNFFMVTGACIAAWPWMPWMLVVVLAFFLFQYGMIISLEEEFLRGKFGDLYRQYCEQVPRILPRLRPYRSGQNRKPSLAAALRSEQSTFLNFLGTFFLIFLRWKLIGG